ncbi:DEAD/DEAH box helicase family protein [Thermodesulfobacteriota bacterium]
MNLRDINWKVRYRSSEDDLIKDFYIPSLERSILYQRAAGYFSTGSLVAAAKGIVALIKNKGKMQLVASPNFSEEDIESIRNGYDKKEKVISNALNRELIFDEEFVIHNRLEAVSWMIANDLLDIKIAYPVVDGSISKGLFHEKMGIFYDSENNYMTFSGSLNESYSAFMTNFESFDVQLSWGDQNSKQLASIKKREFAELWSSDTNNLEIISMPLAIKERLLSIAPSKEPDYQSKNMEEKYHFDIKNHIKKPKSIILRNHQRTAIENWIKNKCRGIFEHATGSGKTISALTASVKLFNLSNNLATIIICPQKHMVDQWKKEANKFGYLPIIGYENSRNWVPILNRNIVNYNIKAIRYFIFITTNKSFGMEKTQRLLSKIKSNFLIIGDEVHNLGASHIRKAFPDNANYRLGLSATPDRWHDEEGTKFIYSYFGETLQPTYGIKEAIKDGHLCEYMYFPHLVYLSNGETDRYHELSYKISKFMNFARDEVETCGNQILKSLLIKRARLIGSAKNKLVVLKRIVKEYKDTYLNLFYCGDGKIEDERQIESVCKVLGYDKDLQMMIDQFTAKENLKERRNLLDKLKNLELQGLVAIRCLDEGVDVPALERAFILASSSNPRQFIQRRGRILRKSQDNQNKIAEIHDFIVVPKDIGNIRTKEVTVFNIERKLVKKELMRFSEFAKTAINGPNANAVMLEIKKQYNLLDI